MILDQYGKPFISSVSETWLTKLWSKELLTKISQPSTFVEMVKITELRKSCGVVSSGSDTIKIRTRMQT